MKVGIVAGLLAMALAATALAQQTMPAGFFDYVTEGIHWKFVSADRQARFGTVFTDAPSEFAPVFMTCRGGQGAVTLTLPERVGPAQVGSVLRISIKGRGFDVRVTKTESMGAPALQGTFELAQFGAIAQGTTASDMVEFVTGRAKMGYAARELAAGYAEFRRACTGDTGKPRF